MISGVDMIAAIQQGKKPQTRRPLKPGQSKVEHCYCQPARVYSVHEKRGEKSKRKRWKRTQASEPLQRIVDRGIAAFADNAQPAELERLRKGLWDTAEASLMVGGRRVADVAKERGFPLDIDFETET